MFQILVTYRCDSKETRDSFYAALKENRISQISEEEKGCICYQYFFPCEDDQALFLLEQWETKEDQKLHAKQPHFALVGELKKQYHAVSEFQLMNAERIG